MSDHVLPGPPDIALTLRRSTRARRISLRISQLDGRVTLTLPNGVPDREALEFAQEKADWIRGHLDKRPAETEVTLGTEIPLDGQLLRVTPGQGRRVEVTPGQIAVPGSTDRIGARLIGFLKQVARTRLAEASDDYAAVLGKPYSRLSIRDTRSRWGSCSSQGVLMYSWRLVMAPPDVLHYVAAHEVAHLQEMNHSADFWAVVEQLYGDYRPPRRWLREKGSQLHLYRFGD